jgi:prevent-host-death family protein
MQPAPQVEPVSNLQRNTPAILRKLDKGPVFLSQRGTLAAAIVSIAEWDQIAHELKRLRRALEMDRQLAQMRAGDYVDFDVTQKPT